MTVGARLLIALDIDGTILGHDGHIPSATHAQVDRLRASGHEVMLATGRSVADTLPIHARLGLDSRFVVSANGATVLERASVPDARGSAAAQGTAVAHGVPDARGAAARASYAVKWVETFDPRDVLLRLRDGLEGALYAVESADGVFRYCGRFPDGSFEAAGREVPFEALLDEPVQRLVVVAPDQSTEQFAASVEGVGLHQVSYSVGWTNWLDIAPEGVNKGVALERVRGELGIARADVVVAGDGRNDIEMLEWAAAGGGRAIVMSEAPQEVIDVGTELTGKFTEDGLARALAGVG